jgi:hypothetical protein
LALLVGATPHDFASPLGFVANLKLLHELATLRALCRPDYISFSFAHFLPLLPIGPLPFPTPNPRPLPLLLILLPGHFFAITFASILSIFSLISASV